MKKFFTVIFATTLLIVFFQNCAKKIEAIPGFALVEKIQVGSDAKVIGNAYDPVSPPTAGPTAQSMIWAPSFSKIELNLQEDSIKQFYYEPDSQGWPVLTGETVCNVSEERVYQTLKSLLTKQEICKYVSTIKEEDRDWGKCPMYAASEADSYYFKVFIPATSSHSEASIGFYSDHSTMQNIDPNCTSSIQVFCSDNEGEVMDQLVKDLTDRFDTFSGCSFSAIK